MLGKCRHPHLVGEDAHVLKAQLGGTRAFYFHVSAIDPGHTHSRKSSVMGNNEDDRPNEETIWNHHSSGTNFETGE